MSQARTVYVGDRATLEQVEAAVRAWQRKAGDSTEYAVEVDGDGYRGMGFSVDVYAEDDAEQVAAANRIANGIRPLLDGVPVVTDRELDHDVAATSAARNRVGPSLPGQ